MSLDWRRRTYGMQPERPPQQQPQRRSENVGLPKLLLSDFTAAVHFDLHLLAILLRGASVMQGDVGIALLLKTLLDLRLAHLRRVWRARGREARSLVTHRWVV